MSADSRRAQFGSASSLHFHTAQLQSSFDLSAHSATVILISKLGVICLFMRAAGVGLCSRARAATAQHAHVPIRLRCILKRCSMLACASVIAQYFINQPQTPRVLHTCQLAQQELQLPAFCVPYGSPGSFHRPLRLQRQGHRHNQAQHVLVVRVCSNRRGSLFASAAPAQHVHESAIPIRPRYILMTFSMLVPAIGAAQYCGRSATNTRAASLDMPAAGSTRAQLSASRFQLAQWHMHPSCPL